MSISVIKHVEVRDKEGKWHLVTWENRNGKKGNETGGNLNASFFSSRGWTPAPFSGRGFPKDMSPELNEMVESHLDEIKKKDTGWGDWWYDKSWCTLDELYNFATERIEKAKNDLKKVYHKMWFSSVDEKLNALLNKEGIHHDSDDDDKYTDQDLEDYYNWFNEAKDLETEAVHIEFLVEAIEGYDPWYDNENIRIVYYFC